jgi:hypothetical protein
MELAIVFKPPTTVGGQMVATKASSVGNGDTYWRQDSVFDVVAVQVANGDEHRQVRQHEFNQPWIKVRPALLTQQGHD